MDELITRTILDTPLGPLIAMATPHGLCALEFDEPKRLELLDRRLQRWFQGFKIQDGVLDNHRNAAAWLGRYFRGEFPGSLDFPIDLRGTAFERQVWQALCEIPVGVTLSYGALASRLELSNGARAIGSAVRRNPISIMVPCHRIIGASGSLTGYGGGLDRKRWFLHHEGALLFNSERLMTT